MGQSPNQAYEEMIGTYCRLDDAIRSVLPQLLRNAFNSTKPICNPSIATILNLVRAAPVSPVLSVILPSASDSHHQTRRTCADAPRRRAQHAHGSDTRGQMAKLQVRKYFAQIA